MQTSLKLQNSLKLLSNVVTATMEQYSKSLQL